MMSKKKADKKEERFETVVSAGKVVVKDNEEDKFIEAKKVLPLGLKMKIKELKAPRKIIASQRKDEFTMIRDDYDYRKDPNLLILSKQVIKWQDGEGNEGNEFSMNALRDCDKFPILFDNLITALRKENGLAVADEEEEKND